MQLRSIPLKWLVALIVIALLGLAWVEVRYSTVTEPDIAIAQHQAQALAPSLQEGDLVFRRGRGFWSETFSNKAGSNLSHVGVLLRQDQDWVVVHSEADDLTLEGGVHTTPLAEFLHNTEFYYLRRLKVGQPQLIQFVAHLREHLARKTPFDTSLSLDDDGERVYCSELIWLAAEKAGVSMAKPNDLLGKVYITIDDLFYSPLLKEIKPD
jgi:hypothetical protein